MNYSELDNYFKVRFEELMNKRTPDSYRVRNHNVLSILEELWELIERWQKHRIQSSETVISCAQECEKLILDDSWIDYSFYDKDLFLKDIKELINTVSENNDKRENIYELSSKLKYACRKCIDLNTRVYADNLFTYLINEIKKSGDMDVDGCYEKEMSSFEKALSSLCNELLRLGHSKNYLYLKAKKLLSGTIKIENLKSQVLSQKLTSYTVVFKLQGNKYLDSCKSEYRFSGNIDDIKTSISSEKQYLKSFFNSNGGKMFRVIKVKALDTYAAIKKAKGEMALLLDTLYLGNNSQFGQFDPKILVISEIQNGKSNLDLRNYEYQLDGTYESDPQVSIRLKSQVDSILGSPLVKDDAKERLKSALRHLRKANDSNDLELRFVNYWIALEFIFSSPINHENTFARIKKHLVNILCYSYVARNVNYLNDLLSKDVCPIKEKHLTEMNDKEWGDLIQNVSDRRTQYRLCKMKSHLHSGQDIDKYIKTHRNNLIWHIARIYRMRNELIHEAALKQDIEGATSNLRFYLVFVLNQLVSYFYSSKIPVSINDFFHEYENRINLVFEKKDRDYVLKATYESSLII